MPDRCLVPLKRAAASVRQTVRSVGMSGTIAGMRLGTSIADEMREEHRRRVLGERSTDQGAGKRRGEGMFLANHLGFDPTTS
jgi:hypothetical protein